MYLQFVNKTGKLSKRPLSSAGDGNGGWLASIRSNFPRNLDRVLKASGLSKKQFARALNVSERSVYQWIDGDNLPELGRLDDIAVVLKTNFIELVRDPDIPLEHQLTVDLIREFARKVGHDVIKKN